MSALQRLSLEKCAVGVAASAVALSALWWWREQSSVERLRRESMAPSLRGEDYVRESFAAKKIQTSTWTKPPSQSHGSGWIYEVFTPPVIYYHAAVRSFSVTPPLAFADAGAPFGLELLDVTLEPYRLQLVGYIGAPGNYIVAFVSPRSPATLLARTGKRFEELELSLQRFDVRKLPMIPDDPRAPMEIAAVAIVRDERSGELVELDSRERKLTDTPMAVLKLGGAAKPREFREGDIFHDESAVYRIERIQLDPPEVLVAREAFGQPYPETRVLKPANAESLAMRKASSRRRFEPASRNPIARTGSPE